MTPNDFFYNGHKLVNDCKKVLLSHTVVLYMRFGERLESSNYKDNQLYSWLNQQKYTQKKISGMFNNKNTVCDNLLDFLQFQK